MSEVEERRLDSPLLSERGVTTISDTVVSRIAGMAAREVEGVHMGGSASRTGGGILESITGSSGQTRGISVQVGRIEVAMDLKMGIDYGRDILSTVEETRRRITDRVQSLTGLRVTELNVIINDIVFPEEQGGRASQALTADSDGRELAETSPASGRRVESTGEPATDTETQAESEPPEDRTAELERDDSEEARRTGPSRS